MITRLKTFSEVLRYVCYCMQEYCKLRKGRAYKWANHSRTDIINGCEITVTRDPRYYLVINEPIWVEDIGGGESVYKIELLNLVQEDHRLQWFNTKYSYEWTELNEANYQ